MLHKNKSESFLSDRPTSLKQSNYDQLRVAIRVRPPLPREIDQGLPFRSISLINKSNQSCSLIEYIGAEFEESERQREWVESPHYFQYHRFTFDHVFDMEASQEEVYNQTAKPSVQCVLDGYNSTIFAYGQTGTGKTYTMEGFTYDYLDPNRGIIPRTIEDIFAYIEMNANSNTKFIIRATYLQIYNESISDLLKPEKKNLSIREDKKRGLYVEGLSEWAVRSPNDIYALLERGAGCRARANTNMNDVSSRSHAVFAIQVEQMIMVNDTGGKQIRVGKLNLVDLAGSERIRVTGAKGKQLEESKNINKSLSALGNVIYALTDNKGRTHIPYRDSKLTRLLESSLGGNCITTMLAMISPAQCSFNESMSTLNFAKRAKNIKNKAVINEDIDHSTLIRQYESELRKLRGELEVKDRMLRSNDFVVELEEKKKQAERDKDEAIQALEQASIKYLQERDEKNKLESKIKIMNFQMIPGGQKVSIEDTPQFQTLLQKHQILIEKSFEDRLIEIEKERMEIEESKEQADQYSKLLYKQRDVMNGLTASLNERDECIAQLQEDIEDYDKITKEQERNMTLKDKRIFMLESILTKNNIAFPKDNDSVYSICASGPRRNSGTSKNKVYISYKDETENETNAKGVNSNGNGNSIVTMLTADEKIDELKEIIKERDKEIVIMKRISDRFINTAFEAGKFSLASIVPSNSSSNGTINSHRQSEQSKGLGNSDITSPRIATKAITHLQSLKSKHSNDKSIQEDLDFIINTLQQQNALQSTSTNCNSYRESNSNTNSSRENNTNNVISYIHTKNNNPMMNNNNKHNHSISNTIKHKTKQRTDLQKRQTSKSPLNIQYIHVVKQNDTNQPQNSTKNNTSKNLTFKSSNDLMYNPHIHLPSQSQPQISNEVNIPQTQEDPPENTIKNIKVTSISPTLISPP